MTTSLALPPGTHTIGVAAVGTSTGSAASIGGAAGDVRQTELTVTFLRQ
jgi:hypothetical protein